MFPLKLSINKGAGSDKPYEIVSPEIQKNEGVYAN